MRGCRALAVMLSLVLATPAFADRSAHLSGQAVQTNRRNSREAQPSTPQPVAKTDDARFAPQPAVILSPYSVSFGHVLVGKASAPQKVTVRNGGTAPLKIAAITLTGDFSQTNDCPVPPSNLNVGGDCGIQVSFTPQTPGDRSGVLDVKFEDARGAHSVALDGVGASGSPNVKLTPGTLTFPEQPLGGTSPEQSAALQNAGTEPLLISSIEVNGDYVIMPSSTCEHLSGPLSPGASCTLVVTFTPLQAGTREGAVVITDNAEDSPQKLALTGNGRPIAYGMSGAPQR